MPISINASCELSAGDRLPLIFKPPKKADRGLDDPDVLAVAAGEGRALVTHDRSSDELETIVSCSA